MPVLEAVTAARALSEKLSASSRKLNPYVATSPPAGDIVYSMRNGPHFTSVTHLALNRYELVDSAYTDRNMTDRPVNSDKQDDLLHGIRGH